MSAARTATTSTAKPPTRTEDDAPLGREALGRNVAWEKVDGAHQSLDPEPDCDGERADLLELAEPFATLDAGERIADPDGHADQLLSSSAKPGRCDVPPVTTISPMPSEPGWFW